ncbi:hypothetical protein R1flu_025318 [Riccia fluitans]|uniref:ABC transporter domain-containing protein n=1 Tax=Riccia fluitans TaxID=41844 RepID=A0ABD1XXE7_9MARC
MERCKKSLEVTAMNFAYPGKPPFISNFNLSLQPGSCCLLIGANGAGKTTLLRILAGKHMVGGRDVGEIPLQGDFSAEFMIFGVDGADPERRQKLIDLLDIDLRWRMHKVSDGQRRRVQICMGLLQPFEVLLLDGNNGLLTWSGCFDWIFWSFSSRNARAEELLLSMPPTFLMG